MVDAGFPPVPRPEPTTRGWGRYPVHGLLFDFGDTLVEEGPFLPGRSPLIGGVAETLPLLEGRYRLGLVSNTQGAVRSEVAQALDALGIGRFFSMVLTSSDIGWRKPHPIIFEAAVASLGTPPERTVMVGNSLSNDVAGAKACGMRTVHFRWSPRYPHSPADEEERPTLVIDDFVELPYALERLEAFPSPAPRVREGGEVENDL